MLRVFVVFAFSVAILAQPCRSSAQENGVVLYENGKYQDAEKALRNAVASTPDDIRARYYLGLSLLQLRRFNESADELQKAKDDWSNSRDESRPDSPSEAQIQIAIGRAYTGLKQYDRALQNLDAAKEKDPNNSEAFLYRGVLFVDQKDYSRALPELEKAIELDQKNAYAHYYAGIAYSNSGKPDKMVGEFQTFLKLAPDAPESAKVRSMLRALR